MAKASPTSAVLPLLVVPHVGETDTDTLIEIPGRPAETVENKEEEQEEEEVEDEFGYSWSEFGFLIFLGVQLCAQLRGEIYILLDSAFLNSRCEYDLQ